jgi:hypothetical protein
MHLMKSGCSDPPGDLRCEPVERLEKVTPGWISS